LRSLNFKKHTKIKTMKKLLLIITLTALVGCKKAEPKPKSNCGTVVAKGYKIDSLGNAYDHSLGIRNELTGNQKTTTPTYAVWSSTQLAQRYCIEGIESW
jgi:hypothetical protein